MLTAPRAVYTSHSSPLGCHSAHMLPHQALTELCVLQLLWIWGGVLEEILAIGALEACRKRSSFDKSPGDHTVLTRAPRSCNLHGEIQTLAKQSIEHAVRTLHCVFSDIAISRIICSLSFSLCLAVMIRY